MSKLTVFALAIVMSGVGSALFAADEIKWHHDLDSALKSAAKEKKLVVVDFYADWCGPCRMMAATTLKDPSVVKALGSYISAKIDVDKQQAAAAKYRVSSIPVIMVLDAKGQPLGRPALGYQDANRFKGILDSAQKAQVELDRLAGNATANPKDAEAAHRLGIKHRDLARYHDAAVWLGQAVKRYPSNAKELPNAKFQLAFVHAAGGQFSKGLQGFETFLREHPQHENAESARGFLPQVIFLAGNQRAEAGDKAGAKTLFQRVLTEYPDSTTATLAREEMVKLN